MVAIPLGLAAAYFLLFSVVFLLFGTPWIGLFNRWGLERSLQPILGVGFGALSLAGLVATLLFLGVSAGVLRAVLIAVLLVSAGFVFRSGFWSTAFGFSRASERGTSLVLFLLVFLYYLLCLSAVLIPSGVLQNFSAARVMELTGFPIDNLITYNAARALATGLELRGLEVVPDWFFSDRGPLAALVVAGFAILTGTQDSGAWLAPTAEPFFAYQALLVYLNLLAVYAAIVVVETLAGHRAALATFALLGSSYSVFQNLIFTWPKFFMSFFALLAVMLMRSGRTALAGFCVAAGILAHDSGMFVALVFALGVVVLAFVQADARRYRRALSALTAFLLGLVPPLAVWSVFSAFWAPKSGRLLYLQLFCFKDAAVDTLSPPAALKRYLAENSPASILRLKLENLLYPFDFSTGFDALLMHWNNPSVLVQAFSFLVPYQFVFGIGLPTCALALFGLVRFRRTRTTGPLQAVLALGIGALLPAVAVIGCPLATWIHHWAYLGLLGVAMYAGYTVSCLGKLGLVLLAVAVGTNGFFLIGLHLRRANLALMPIGAGAGVFLGLLIAIVIVGGLSMVTREKSASVKLHES